MHPRHLLPVILATTATLFGVSPEPVLRFPAFLVEEKIDDTQRSPATKVSFVAAITEANPAGLADRIPNFSVAESGAHSFNDTFNLRGLTNTPIFGDAAVTFYLDDIPLGGGFTTPDSFLGVDHASLFRGPGQITRFGRAGSAGVVQLSTEAPAQRSGGELDANLGNYSARSVSVKESSSVGKIDELIAIGYNARKGYIYNHQLGQDADHRESLSALARINARVFEGFTLSFVAQGERARDGEQPLVPLDGPFYIIDRKTQGKTDFSSVNAGLTAKIAQSWGELSATTSINDWHLGPYRSSLSFGPAELVSDVDLKRRNYNQELAWTWITGPDFRLHTGVFLSQESTEGAFTRRFDPYVIEDSSYEISARRIAAFSEADWKLSPNVTVTMGARVEDVKKTMDRSEHVPSTQTYSMEHNSGSFLPKATIAWDLNASYEVFGSIGGGYKPGGFSAFTGNRALSAFGAERTVGAETGMSFKSADHRLEWTTRAFAYQIRGYQIERSFATGAASDDYLVVNAPKARSVGGEVELKWRIASDWTVSSSYGFTDAQLREFTDPYTGQTYTGKRTPYVPQSDFIVQCAYQATKGWFAMVRWSAAGRTYYTESEDAAFAQRAYNLLGCRFGYSANFWRVTLYAENILDKQYYASMAAGTRHGTPGTPRILGAEISLGY